jgi:hypothetical protein
MSGRTIRDRGLAALPIEDVSLVRLSLIESADWNRAGRSACAADFQCQMVIAPKA